MYNDFIYFEADYSMSSSSSSMNQKKRKATNKIAKTRVTKDRKQLASGYRFVYKAGKRWQVRVKHRHQTSYVGVFGTPEEAAAAADYAVHELGFPKEKLNFPNKPQAAVKPTPAVSGRINDNPQAQKNKTGFKGVHEVSSSKDGGGANKYYVQVFKDNVTYTLPEKFDTKEIAARAFDKMAVSLGRSAGYLNFPNEFDGWMKTNEAELDCLVLSYLREKKLENILSELQTAGFGQGSANIPPAGTLQDKVNKGSQTSRVYKERTKKKAIVSHAPTPAPAVTAQVVSNDGRKRTGQAEV